MLVFLDMDGVLVDLWPTIFPNIVPGLAGENYGPVDWSKYDISWWAKLPTTPEYDAIMELTAPAAPYLLTSGQAGVACHAGKAAWNALRGCVPASRLIICQHKWLMAAGNILIDDSDSNIEAWERAGGVGILFPRPWNSLWGLADDPMTLVRERYLGVTEVDHG